MAMVEISSTPDFNNVLVKKFLDAENILAEDISREKVCIKFEDENHFGVFICMA